MFTVTYRAGAELPGLTLPWQEELTQDVWTDLNLSGGWTFTLTLVTLAGVAATPTPTPNITGHDGYVTIAWTTGDLDIPAGTYLFKLRAEETATSKHRDYSPNNWPKLVIN